MGDWFSKTVSRTRSIQFWDMAPLDTDSAAIILGLENGPEWSESLSWALADGQAVGWVARYPECAPVGFAAIRAVTSKSKSVRIEHFQVIPRCRRRGIGRGLLNEVIEEANAYAMPRVLISCRERNLDGQLFLKASGFKARRVFRGYFEDTGEDAFEFVLKLER